MSNPFDDELVEHVSHLETDYGIPCAVEIYKIGGGTAGIAYAGTWGYRLTCDGAVVTQGEDLQTGMPKTHDQVARIVVEFLADKIDARHRRHL